MLSTQPATAHVHTCGPTSSVVVREPLGAQTPSENSQSAPDAKLFVGHGPPPSVVGLTQTPVLKSHGPSPVSPGPSTPPTHVWNVFGSNASKMPSGFVTLSQLSKCPISCCMRTPPSSAAHGTWFCLAAV